MLQAGRLEKPYAGIVDCFKRTYADEGMVSVCVLAPESGYMETNDLIVLSRQWYVSSTVWYLGSSKTYSTF
jgi:hypothetical protein